MKAIRVTTEIGSCVACGKRLRGHDLYYDIDGMWVHVKCFENYDLAKEKKGSSEATWRAVK